MCTSEKSPCCVARCRQLAYCVDQDAAPCRILVQNCQLRSYASASLFLRVLRHPTHYETQTAYKKFFPLEMTRGAPGSERRDFREGLQSEAINWASNRWHVTEKRGLHVSDTTISSIYDLNMQLHQEWWIHDSICIQYLYKIQWSMMK